MQCFARSPAGIVTELSKKYRTKLSKRGKLSIIMAVAATPPTAVCLKSEVQVHGETGIGHAIIGNVAAAPSEC